MVGVFDGSKGPIRMLWTDSCDIYVRKKTQNADTKRTEFGEACLCARQACRLSFKSVVTAKETDHAAQISQGVKLFIDKDISIPPGAKIVVHRGDRTLAYTASGTPAIYSHHQEVPLELFERWA